jgi:hypothetical protein
LARIWTSRRKVTQDDGWSDFLGRDESDTTLSSRVVEVEAIDLEGGLDADVDVERKSSTPKPDQGVDEDAVSLDLIAALGRGPSRDRDGERDHEG